MTLPGAQYAQMFSFWTAWFVANATSLLTALIVLIVGWYAAAILSRRLGDVLRRTRRIDSTLRPLVTQLVRYSILTITLIIVLGQFGVQTASILAVIGAIGLAIALALQGTLSNIAAGVMLIWLRPFNVGEYIDAEGIAGTVTEVGLFGTRLKTFDGIYTFAPNSRIWNARIINYSREKTRMIDTPVGIAYTADIARARQIMLEIARDPRVLAEPAPSVYVASLGDSSVTITQRIWVNAKDWWDVKTAMIEEIKLAFDASGIEIPYDKLDVYIKEGLPPAADIGSRPTAASPGDVPIRGR